MIDNTLQSHAGPIFGRIYFSDAVALQGFNFFGNDDTPAAAKNFDVSRALLFETIDDIFKKFEMPALIAGNANSLGIFFNRRIDNFFNRSIMTEMNHFRTGALQDTTHDINRRVMAIKKGSCRNDSNLVLRFVYVNVHAYAPFL